MESDNKKTVNLDGYSIFDYTKNWYLVPTYLLTNYVPKRVKPGPLYEGLILTNEEQFSETDIEKINSFILITDFDKILQNLFEPFVYPIKIKNGTRVKHFSNTIWLAEKVELLKPLNFWEVILQTADIYSGTIDIECQSYLPNNLKLPSIVKGSLTFFDSKLPCDIQLPDSVEETILIQFCEIPPTWQFPKKMKSLILENCTFYENIDFNKISLTNVEIFNCNYPSIIPFPDFFSGTLSIDIGIISSEFRFPKCIGNLFLGDLTLNKGAKLPEKVNHNLTFIKVVMPEAIKLPNYCKEFSAIECNFSKGIILPIKGLNEIEMIACTLPQELTIPDVPNLKLSFMSMIIPAGIKIGKEFNGSLEFTNCEFTKGFKLPAKIIGSLTIAGYKFNGLLKLPKNGDYDFCIRESDDISNFDIPDSIKSKIIILPTVDDSGEF